MEHICDSVDKCLGFGVECVHSKSHVSFDYLNLGCKRGYCGLIGKDVKCVSVRKIKLEKLKKVVLIKIV